MKARPHIVTQTRVYDTTGLRRNADLLAARMGTAGSLKNFLGYSRTLIRIMKIILDLTLRNDCFVAKREVLDSPRLRARVTEQIGGAHALLKWRRQNTWNKARLAAIASGEYRPSAEPVMPAARRAKVKPEAVTSKPAAVRPATPALKPFRLPVLQNLRYVPRAAPASKRRARAVARYPSIVMWPHELDGQFVPNFISRARRPDAGGFPPYAADKPASGSPLRRIFAPP